MDNKRALHLHQLQAVAKGGMAMMPGDQWFEDQYGVDVERTSIELRKQLEREETERQRARRLIALERDREMHELIDTNQCQGIALCDQRCEYESLKRRYEYAVLALVALTSFGGACVIWSFFGL